MAERKGGGFLTTHVLDLASGLPAVGLKIELFKLSDGVRQHLASATTNADGRTDAPILAAVAFATGTYELVFAAGDYLKRSGAAAGENPFLDQIPIRFGIDDVNRHYHVPLLLSPYGYSTYRGS